MKIRITQNGYLIEYFNDRQSYYFTFIHKYHLSIIMSYLFQGEIKNSIGELHLIFIGEGARIKYERRQDKSFKYKQQTKDE